MSDIVVTLKLSVRQYSMLREGLDSSTNELQAQLDATKGKGELYSKEIAIARKKITEKMAEIELLKGKLDA